MLPWRKISPAAQTVQADSRSRHTHRQENVPKCRQTSRMRLAGLGLHAVPVSVCVSPFDAASLASLNTISSQIPMPPICFSPGVALCRALTPVPVQATPLGDQDSSGRWLTRHQLRSARVSTYKDDHPNGAGGSVKRPWASGCYQRSFHRRRPREPIDILTDLPKREAIDKGPSPAAACHCIYFSFSALCPYLFSPIPLFPRETRKRDKGGASHPDLDRM
ncbi:hypothetical protein GGI42DRAFT_222767 [Trichoderma sp. SZMC 28013]